MRRVSAVIGLVTLVALAHSSAQATHIPNHQYSEARDNSGTAYTAVSTYRNEGDFILSLGANCTTPYAGNPVYQSMWITWNATDFIELGTGHQRGSNGYCRYRYWGYWLNNAWHSVGTQILGDGLLPATRTILGIRPPSSCSATSRCWQWKVGGVVLNSIKLTTTGVRVDVGLESYDTAALAYSHTYESLLYKVNDGGWTSWGGRDFNMIGTNMCGLWVFDDYWRAGENTTC